MTIYLIYGYFILYTDDLFKILTKNLLTPIILLNYYFYRHYIKNNGNLLNILTIYIKILTTKIQAYLYFDFYSRSYHNTPSSPAIPGPV